MSTVKLTKKQKKGEAFRERKAKKRSDVDNASEEVRAVPATDIIVDDDETSDLTTVKESKVEKKRKRESKEDVRDSGNAGSASKKPKLSKGTEKEEGKSVTGKSRFILFVGNLKYTTTIEAIREHFSACDPPPEIRLLTPKPKKPTSTMSKSKGCAFLEFSHRNALQQGLKLHGSTLDGRNINVELTAGGGGKSESRIEKVKARNKQLIEQRKARLVKKSESGGEPDVDPSVPPQRRSMTSGMEESTQKRRTWSIPQNGEESGRGGIKRRGKKNKKGNQNWGTGANSISLG